MPASLAGPGLGQSGMQRLSGRVPKWCWFRGGVGGVVLEEMVPEDPGGRKRAREGGRDRNARLPRVCGP